MSISDTKSAITAGQSRAARGLLGWSQDGLATKSGVSKRTIVRFELDRAQPQAGTLIAIHAALQKAGVIFIDENGEGHGVRLRKKKR